ncbi:hypothetical protein [Methylobacillus flagellatus]|uniref:hypothetical protein n=1 Tax=Methylobacillus flagellatus TaxID=405 RepID=UPI0010F9632A|nr:hypothetical protein [Methylobacillus flagellatus]
MGVENIQAGIDVGVLTLRLSIRPVDGNQKADEENLHTQNLQSVQIHDDFVINKLSELFDNHPKGISEIRLEILSKGKILAFSVAPGASGLGFLPLLVQRTNG